MRSQASEGPERLSVTYEFFAAQRWNSITATGDKPAFQPKEDTPDHFFKEHHWGFGISRSGRLLRYEVTHPVWDICSVRAFHIDVDWAGVYGREWGFLRDATPAYTTLAIGSRIAVYPSSRPL